MAAADLIKLSRGAYSAPEAARIAHLQSRRVRRWLDGYNFKSPRGEARRSGPVFPREHDASSLALTFMDLVEVLYVAAFVTAGVPMRLVKLVHSETEAEFGVRHPFAMKRMETDGKSIFHRCYEQGAERITDRKLFQLVDRTVFNPLMKRLEYEKLTDEAARYWPLGRERPVLLDPRQSFGEAIVTSGVPTRVIQGATRSGEPKLRIARWYGITVEEVTAAVAYEQSIASPAQAA